MVKFVNLTVLEIKLISNVFFLHFLMMIPMAEVKYWWLLGISSCKIGVFTCVPLNSTAKKPE